MFNTAHRLSWFSSLATAAFLGLMTLLSGCGGGGATTPEQAQQMTVVPGSAIVYAYADTQTVLTVRAGKKPFNVYSSNTAIISFNNATMPGGKVPDEAIVLEGPTGNYGRVNNVDIETSVVLTVRDADGVQVQVTVKVEPSSLNNSLTVTSVSSTGTAQTFINSGQQGQASVQATTITGGPVSGHKVRFRVMDQGAKYGFVCNQSLGDCLVIETDSAGRAINVETTTDRNGNAFAVIKVDVNAPTQFATISATDLVTGHVLRKQFMIAGTALATLGSGTWTITLPIRGDLNGDGDTTDPTESDKMCPDTVVYSSYFIYGGTPPYKVASTSPLVGFPMLPPLTVTAYPVTMPTQPITVQNIGDSFLMVWPCTPDATGKATGIASGEVNIMITDGSGLVLVPAPTFKVTVN